MEQPEPSFMAQSRQLLKRLGISAADAESFVGASLFLHALKRPLSLYRVRRSPPTAAAQGADLAQKGREEVWSTEWLEGVGSDGLDAMELDAALESLQLEHFNSKLRELGVYNLAQAY